MIPFSCADILLPKQGFEKWAVIACDQFTSDRSYWERCEKNVGKAPSALRVTLPEIYLSGDVGARTEKINETMAEYLSSGVFETFPDSMIFVKRTLPDGKTRLGVVGKIDLEYYSFEKGAKPLIRPTEQTVLDRIPPRVKIRENAPIELPHVMLLVDNAKKTVIEPLLNEDMRTLYDFDLMEGGGHIEGKLIPSEIQKKLLEAMERDLRPDFPFAVGDGNHSLATAKACYENDKKAGLDCSKSRYALCEIVNIHDDSLEFEPIYRTVFNVLPEELYHYLSTRLDEGDKVISMLSRSGKKILRAKKFAVEELQNCLDAYLANHPECRIDYIHGLKNAENLAGSVETASFVFEGIGKNELLPLVDYSGVLPRKTFSMGEAESKRYYIEARLIK